MFSVEAGSFAGLHDSTPLGDRRRTLLGVPVATGPHAREPRPPAATLQHVAEAPAADWASGPGVLGRAAARVGAMVRCGSNRGARDGDRVAPYGLMAVLEVALEAGKVARWQRLVGRSGILSGVTRFLPRGSEASQG